MKAELNDCEDLMIKISERDKFIIDLKNKIKLQSDDIKGANLRSGWFLFDLIQILHLLLCSCLREKDDKKFKRI